jgi:hypothetical protein
MLDGSVPFKRDSVSKEIRRKRSLFKQNYVEKAQDNSREVGKQIYHPYEEDAMCAFYFQPTQLYRTLCWMLVVTNWRCNQTRSLFGCVSALSFGIG